MTNLDASKIRVAGTGNLWKAPIGTPIPTDGTTSLNAAFVNLGYEGSGFTVTQDLKTQGITAWQSLDFVRMINTALTRKVAFDAIESNKQTLSLAWGGATATNTGTAVGGAVTISTAGAITTATAHGFSVGAPVVLGAITTSTGILAGVQYYVIAVGSATTLTLSATLGGVALTTTAGSSASIASAAPYSLTIPDSAVASEFILIAEWQDGSVSQRLIFQRSALLTLPPIKFGREDAVRYPLEVQVLKPSDGTQSVLIYGVDSAATA